MCPALLGAACLFATVHRPGRTWVSGAPAAAAAAAALRLGTIADALEAGDHFPIRLSEKGLLDTTCTYGRCVS